MQSRMDFNQQILGMIDNNPSSMHREYHEFYAVHVYLRSIRISLIGSLFSLCALRGEPLVRMMKKILFYSCTSMRSLVEIHNNQANKIILCTLHLSFEWFKKLL